MTCKALVRKDGTDRFVKIECLGHIGRLAAGQQQSDDKKGRYEAVVKQARDVD